MLLKRGAGDLALSGSGRVWILKEEPMGCANELQVENERGRVKNNLEGFCLSIRKEGGKKGTMGKP